jgi:hypothetical protein
MMTMVTKISTKVKAVADLFERKTFILLWRKKVIGLGFRDFLPPQKESAVLEEFWRGTGAQS